jgi:protein arginine kinase
MPASDIALLIKELPHWARGDNGEIERDDIVISSRARLARNIATYPFPHRATPEERRMIAQAIRQAAKSQDLGLLSLEIATLTNRERDALVDSRRLSPDMLGGLPEQVALLDRQGVVSLLIHEEDHLRLQVILPGNQLADATAKAHEIEAKLASRLTFAHDAVRWGYLTTGLNNTGTGLRVSAQLHLPALAVQGRLNSVLEATYNLSGAVRGPVGEHSQIAGDLVQISNGVSAGHSTDFFVSAVSGAVKHLVDAEKEARIALAASVPETILKTATRYWNELAEGDELTTEDALRYLSLFRLTHLLNLATGPDTKTFVELVALLDIRGQDTERNRLRIRLSRLRNALRPHYS